jgi:hydroxyacylglutathione hydrolase
LYNITKEEELVMRILPNIYLVGSGDFGFNLSHEKDCNVYLVDGGNGLTLIDTGVGLANNLIEENIKSHGFDLGDIKQIILTHCHADHSGGASYFKQKTGAKVLVHANEADMLSQADEDALGLRIAKKAGFYPPDYKLNACKVDIKLEEDMEIKIGRFTMKVIWTPGHSSGSISLYGVIDGKRTIFTGCAVFYGGTINLQNIPGADIHDSAMGVRKLSGLNVEVFLPGHMLFSFSNGQRHIDMAVEAFNKLGLPKSLL